jgi:hypothetical protein
MLRELRGYPRKICFELALKDDEGTGYLAVEGELGF